MSGDCDFNFNQTKYALYKNLLKSEEQLQLLEACANNNHKVINFSLMPRTGGMNNLKGSLYITKERNPYDRLDAFVYHLDLFYKKKDNTVLKRARSNEEPLTNFLHKFDNIYDYCNKLYFIDDRKFVDKMILNGQKPLVDAEDVMRYMEIACEYWKIREVKFLKK